MKFPRIFKKLGKIKRKSIIKDFSITLMSLEEMFIKMAQKRQHKTYGDLVLEQM